MGWCIGSVAGWRKLSACCALVATAALLECACVSAPTKPDVTSATSLTGDVKASDNMTQAVDTANLTPSDSPAKKKPFKSPMLAKTFEEAASRGDAAWFADNVESALYFYVQALSFRPRDVTTLTKMGVIEQRTGNLALAARAYGLAVDANPSDPRLSAQLGLVYLALGQDDTAHTWLLKSATSESADWRVYDGLGIIEERRGNDADALPYLQRAANAGSRQSAAPLLHRGQALFSTGAYPEAETAVRGALTHEATPEAWQLLGKIQAKRGAYGESLDSLFEALDAPTAYATVAKVALENGDNALALSYFERASSLSPVYLPDVERDANKARERLAIQGGAQEKSRRPKAES